MAKQIALPDGSVGEFPDAMPDSEIEKVLAREFPTTEGSGTRFLKNLWEQVNPAAIVGGMANTAMHPLDTLRGVLSENQRLADEATNAAKKGDYATAVRKGLSFAVQVLPGAGSTLDAAATQAQKGDIAGSAGKSVGLGAQIALAPKVLPAAARAAEGARALPGKAVAAVKSPGMPEIIKGGADVAGGTAAVLSGNPYAALYGATRVARGVPKLAEGIAARRAAAAAPVAAAAAEDTALLDGIANNLARGKKFADLDPAEQQQARSIADRIQGAPPPGAQAPTGRSSIPAAVLDPNREFVAPPPRYPPPVAARPAPDVVPATEPLPAAVAPQPPEAAAVPQVSGTALSESPSPAVPGTIADMVRGSKEATSLTPEIMTEDQLAKHAASFDVPVEEARRVVTDAGYKVVGRSYLNRALHGLGNEMGLDHDAISTKAAQDYGVKSLTQLSQEQMLEMLNDLQGKRSISEPLPKKGATP